MRKLVPLLLVCFTSTACVSTAASPLPPSLACGRVLSFNSSESWLIPENQWHGWRVDADGWHCLGGVRGNGPRHPVVCGIVHLYIVWRTQGRMAPFRIEGFGPMPDTFGAPDRWNTAHLAFEDGRATLTVNDKTLIHARYISSEGLPPDRRLVLVNTGNPVDFSYIIQVDR